MAHASQCYIKYCFQNDISISVSSLLFYKHTHIWWNHRYKRFIIIIMMESKIKFCNLLKFACCNLKTHLITDRLIWVITYSSSPHFSPLSENFNLYFRENNVNVIQLKLFSIHISHTHFTCNHDNHTCYPHPAITPTLAFSGKISLPLIRETDSHRNLTFCEKY